MTDADIRLEGAPNFRDMGGYPTRDGRRVRRRQLFRSEGLAHLTPRDHEALRPLGIRLVCDVRSPRERDLHPSNWPADQPAHQLHFDISADMRAANPILRQILLDEPTERGARAMMLHTYRVLPGAFAGRLHELFDRLLDGGLPVLVHCTAGKDRTGFVSAMLLSALGVAEEHIYQDFLRTAQFTDLDRLAASVGPTMIALLGTAMDRRVLDTINGVHPEFLDTALAALCAEYGSVDRYLEKAGGLTAAKREELRRLLLE